MKTFFVLFVLTISLFGAHIDEFAAGMGYERNYDQALAKAKAQNKPLMMVVVGDTCPWCRKFERKTLSQQAIAFQVVADFIPLIIDRKNDAGKYPEKYNAPRIPTVYFIEPQNETLFFESMGYVKQNDYEQILKDVKHDIKEKK